MENKDMSQLSDENREMELAWRLAEHTGLSLFLTGKAGTGKTTFLRRLRSGSAKRIVVLAPTGIAAINAGGVTIHSFFQLPLHPFTGRVEREGKNRISAKKLNLIRGLDMIVIDEVSMVRADLLDAIDYELRRIRRSSAPFGGVQMLLIGDLQQLPPVVTDSDAELLSPLYSTSYFFGSHALEALDYKMIELRKVYRQSDREFVDLLNSIRDNTAGPEELRRLNTRYIRGFEGGADEDYIRLTTHNDRARSINERQLNAIPGKMHEFAAVVKKDFPEQLYPAEQVLRLKAGAQVMFIKNDLSPEKNYYNGLIGRVEDFAPGCVYVRVKGRAEAIKVMPENWENVKFTVDDAGDVKTEVQGVFTQLPLQTAWAVTIHKSQGLTFDKAIIDASRAFAHGQCYVALSRCRSLEGIVLEQPLSPSAIITDPLVGEFMRRKSSDRPAPDSVAGHRQNYRLALLDELFSVASLQQDVSSAQRTVLESFGSLHPALSDSWRTLAGRDVPELMRVSAVFAAQYRQLLEQGDDGRLCQRLDAANDYYSGALRQIIKTLDTTPAEVDNARLGKRLKADLRAVRVGVEERLILFGELKGSGYKVEALLGARAASRLAESEEDGKKKAVMSLPDEIGNPGLYGALMDWRRRKSAELGVPPYRVISYKALIGIAEICPEGVAALRRVERVSRARVAQYGEELLEICRRFSDTAEDEHYGPESSADKQEESDAPDVDSLPELNDKQLSERLRTWRSRKAEQMKAPAFVVCSNRTLDAIVEARPATMDELLDVSGVGAKTAERYGSEILAIVNRE